MFNMSYGELQCGCVIGLVSSIILLIVCAVSLRHGRKLEQRMAEIEDKIEWLEAGQTIGVTGPVLTPFEDLPAGVKLLVDQVMGDLAAAAIRGSSATGDARRLQPSQN